MLAKSFVKWMLAVFLSPWTRIAVQCEANTFQKRVAREEILPGWEWTDINHRIQGEQVCWTYWFVCRRPPPKNHTQPIFATAQPRYLCPEAIIRVIFPLLKTKECNVVLLSILSLLGGNQFWSHFLPSALAADLCVRKFAQVTQTCLGHIFRFLYTSTPNRILNIRGTKN